MGPGDPTWRKLYEELAALAVACGGPFAFVVDEGNGLWCVGRTDSSPTATTPNENRAADRFYREEVVPRMASMRRGKPFVVAKTDGDDRYAALSFASIYVLVVWFDAPFAVTLVHARMRRALPMIESLTLSLPPAGGPGTSSLAGKLRA